MAPKKKVKRKEKIRDEIPVVINSHVDFDPDSDSDSDYDPDRVSISGDDSGSSQSDESLPDDDWDKTRQRYSKEFKIRWCNAFDRLWKESGRNLVLDEFRSNSIYWHDMFGHNKEMSKETCRKWFKALNIKSEYFHFRSSPQEKHDYIISWFHSNKEWDTFIKKGTTPLSTARDWKELFYLNNPKLCTEQMLFRSDLNAEQYNALMIEKEELGNEWIEVVDHPDYGRCVRAKKHITIAKKICIYGKIVINHPGYTMYSHRTKMKVDDVMKVVWVIPDPDDPHYGEMIACGVPTTVGGRAHEPNVKCELDRSDPSLGDIAYIVAKRNIKKDEYLFFGYSKEFFGELIGRCDINLEQKKVLRWGLSQKLKCW